MGYFITYDLRALIRVLEVETRSRADQLSESI